jgi:methionyl-tRNA formyltransferase
MNKEIKVIFMGTPKFAVPILESLIDNYNVVLVVCQPDKEKDKKGNIIYPPVKKVALENNIPIFQPNKIREEYQQVLDYKPDIIITCAYGQIIPDIILEYPKYGCINVHGSLLPKLRGGAPIHWAIINGDKETGITIMNMVSKMDAGDIISQKSIPILDSDYLDIVYDKLSLVGRDLLLETLPSIINGTSKRIKQDDNLVTFGMNIKKEEEKIDFNKSSKDIRNLIRGLNSEPGAYCIFEKKRLKIYDSIVIDKRSSKDPGTIEEVTKDSLIVSTKDFLLAIKEIKLEGKKRCLVKDYLNGISDKKSLIGKVLK